MLFSIVDAAKLLGGISHWTLRKHIAASRVGAVRIGRRLFLDSEELERIRREGLPSVGSKSPAVSDGSETEHAAQRDTETSDLPFQGLRGEDQ
jgi:hypothetical protein